jgi:hypothetical protein
VEHYTKKPSREDLLKEIEGARMVRDKQRKSGRLLLTYGALLVAFFCPAIGWDPITSVAIAIILFWVGCLALYLYPTVVDKDIWEIQHELAKSKEGKSGRSDNEKDLRD